MNNFTLSEDTKVLLLLCCQLVPKAPYRPLTLVEYNRLAKVLFERNLTPSSLLEDIDLEGLASLSSLKEKSRLKG